MRRILAFILLSLSVSAYADYKVDLAILSGDDGHVYVDIGSEKTRLELLFAYEPSVSVKHAFSLNHNFDLWLGVGLWGFNERFQDSFGNNGADSNYFPVVFIELEHDSGVFIRGYHYEGTASTTIHHKHYELVGVNLVLNEGGESFSRDISENKVVIGYKWKF